jgi:hypothetical protein
MFVFISRAVCSHIVATVEDAFAAFSNDAKSVYMPYLVA